MTPHPDSLQFVLFLTAPPQTSAVEVWQAHFGQFPDSFQKGSNNSSQAGGIVNGYSTTIAVANDRIDVLITPPGKKNPSTEGAPFFDDLDAAAASGESLFLGICSRYRATAFRPAFVFQAFEQAADDLSAVKLVADLFPQLPLPPGANEIEYRVVVPGSTELPQHQRISRLFRCFSGRKLFIPNASPLLDTISLPSISVTVYYADVFTPNDAKVPEGDFDALVKEMVTLAKAIISRGYDALLSH